MPHCEALSRMLCAKFDGNLLTTLKLWSKNLLAYFLWTKCIILCGNDYVSRCKSATMLAVLVRVSVCYSKYAYVVIVDFR